MNGGGAGLQDAARTRACSRHAAWQKAARLEVARRSACGSVARDWAAASEHKHAVDEGGLHDVNGQRAVVVDVGKDRGHVTPEWLHRAIPQSTLIDGHFRTRVSTLSGRSEPPPDGGTLLADEYVPPQNAMKKVSIELGSQLGSHANKEQTIFD